MTIGISTPVLRVEALREQGDAAQRDELARDQRIEAIRESDGGRARRFGFSMLVLLASTAVAGAAAGRPQPRVHVFVRGLALPSAIVVAALEELRSIWSVYGVDVNDEEHSLLDGSSAIRIEIALLDSTASAEVLETLGTIRFHDDTPDRKIAVYPAAIERLVASASLPGGAYRNWPRGMQQMMLGRVLGRALAHELGHYLLRSQRHSPKGLMRSTIPVWALVGADRHGFALSSDDETRLEKLLFKGSPVATGVAGE